MIKNDQIHKIKLVIRYLIRCTLIGVIASVGLSLAFVPLGEMSVLQIILIATLMGAWAGFLGGIAFFALRWVYTD